MRIVVVGPGAMGCLLAGLLSKEAEVWLLARDQVSAEHIISHKGVSSEGVSGSWKAEIPATANPQDIGNADLIIIATKAYDTQEAVIHARPLITPSTIVLTLQNGLGNFESIADIVGKERVLAGVTHQAVTRKEPGMIEHKGEGPTVIAYSGKAPEELKHIKTLFSKAGINVKVSDNMPGVLWSKVVLNAGINAVAAITRLHNGDLIKEEPAFEVLKEAVLEAANVARRKRIQLLYTDPVKEAVKVCRMTAGNKCSMWQDIEAGKMTEVDFLNGAIVREGEKCRVATPVNSVLCNLVRAMEGRGAVSAP